MLKANDSIDENNKMEFATLILSDSDFICVIYFFTTGATDRYMM